MTADPRRRLALDALLAVGRGRSLESALGDLRGELSPGKDAAVAEELVRGALQWQGRYDFLVRRFSRREPNRDPVVRGVLHLALHQLLTSRAVPTYAAVHQAGELLRAARRPRAVGYVNAVLQALQRHLAIEEASDRLAAAHRLFIDATGDEVDYLAAWWSHPRWLVERWYERYGPAETAALLEHANTPPPLTLHVLPPRSVEAAKAALAAAGVDSTTRPDQPRALRLGRRLERSRLRDLLAEIPGLVVQDAGAQAVVDWLTRGGAALADAGGPAVDCCAAPGGKTVHLRSLLAPARLLVALDLHPRRLGRVRENRDRLRLDGVALVAGDAIRPPLRCGSCAVVLVDGPCSGTGVGRHHPEGRWRLAPATLDRNAGRLRELANAAADLLGAGGSLYYATCSLEPEENEEVVAALLDSRDDLEPDPDSDGRYVRAWLPWRHDTDGFFAARLRRRDRSAG
ncbi:MAG TPA: transcription antitermination factor NusB [Candidatus Krumholzibacteria bacterium]|nr:transcription antitermination factor NusB [Candidatus Krumholzibacteria bacterium]HPD71378.1 transcription antitermination factor NusB [Candidatus Krumholzibacteria bacterium]HRY38922.1 transcription antitermination factor NusB [Candidatus Krumholzibacteria bacterium]